MTGTPPLPPLYEASLDATQVAALFADLEAAGLAVQVVVRARARRAVEGCRAAPTLAEARALLEGASGAAVQLRYRYEGALWWDTLTPTPAGVRLIRVAHDPDAFGSDH